MDSGIMRIVKKRIVKGVVDGGIKIEEWSMRVGEDIGREDMKKKKNS